jgi:hypothetical protein
MRMSPLLTQSLLGGATGAAVGGTVGAALGAATAKPGQRGEEAKKWGKRGLIGGGLGGLVAPSLRSGRAYLVGKAVLKNEHDLEQLYSAARGASSFGERLDLLDRVQAQRQKVEALGAAHQALLAPVPNLEVARQATIGGGVGASVPIAVSRLTDFLKARLHSRSASPPATSATSVTPEEKTASRALTVRGHLPGRVTLGKYANDPLAPDKGEPLQYETTQDRKARRVAELLKRSMPTGTAEGSASPTPKRGTP